MRIVRSYYVQRGNTADKYKYLNWGVRVRAHYLAFGNRVALVGAGEVGLE